MAWIPPTATQRIATIRGAIEVQLDTSIEWEATPDGAWTAAAGIYASRVDQGWALALAARSRQSADPTALAALAAERGIPRRAAEPARILVEVTGVGDDEVQPGDVVEGFGATWDVVEVYDPGVTPPVATEPTPTGIPIEAESLLVLQAQTPGRLTLPTGASAAIDFVPPKDDIALAYGGSSDILYRGADAETIPQLRARLDAAQTLPVGSPAGVVAALRALPGVDAVSVEVPSPGTVEIAIAGSTGQGDFVRAAEEIYQRVALGIVTSGDQFVRLPGADGREVTILLSEADTETVDVAVVLSTVAGVDRESLRETASFAIIEQFGRLDRGDTLRWFAIVAAMALPSVLRATVTLRAGTADIEPASASTLLIPGTIAITVQDGS